MAWPAGQLPGLKPEIGRRRPASVCNPNRNLANAEHERAEAAFPLLLRVRTTVHALFVDAKVFIWISWVGPLVYCGAEDFI